MSGLPIVILILLGVGALLTALLALAFYRDPVAGMAEATHRPVKLPLVMIDRYLAVTVIQIGLFFFGTLELVAVFCVAGMIMGFGDGLIYARAGHPHMKHTSSGILAFVALLVTLYYIIATGSVA